MLDLWRHGADVRAGGRTGAGVPGVRGEHPLIAESAETHPLERLGEPLGTRRAVGEAVETAHDDPAAEADQRNALPLSGTPPHRVPRRNVEAHAPGPRAVEDEPAIDLEERVV